MIKSIGNDMLRFYGDTKEEDIIRYNPENKGKKKKKTDRLVFFERHLSLVHAPVVGDIYHIITLVKCLSLFIITLLELSKMI